MFASTHGFDPGPSSTKDFKICNHCFSVEHTAIKDRVTTGWLEFRIMGTSGVTGLPRVVVSVS